jgi:hypothetical protein
METHKRGALSLIKTPQPFPDRHDPDLCTLEGLLPLFIIGEDETFLDGSFGPCSFLDDEIAFPSAFVIEETFE